MSERTPAGRRKVTSRMTATSLENWLFGVGIDINLSKHGAGVTIGERGAQITVGTQGVTETVGLPGSGLYWTERQSWGGSHGQPPASQPSPQPSPQPPSPRPRMSLTMFLLLIFGALAALAALASWLG